MRITVEIPKRKKYKPIEIADAVYQKDFKIKIFFQDGTI